jgi:protein Tex
MFEKHIASELSLGIKQVLAVLGLLEEGSTVPFIARYRKERTGGLDEVQIIAIKNAFDRLTAFQKRKEYIVQHIEEQGKLTDILKQQIEDATELAQLEDLYLPYKTRRKTRADVAREKGLEPLAKIIFEQKEPQVLNRLHHYTNEKVPSAEDALQGARDIIAEWINEDAEVRAHLRQQFEEHAWMVAKPARGKKEDAEAQKFRDYFEFNQKLTGMPSHRFLAIMRGQEQGYLSIKVEPDTDKSLRWVKRKLLRGYNDLSDEVATALEDAYQRLLQPSLENEFLAKEKQRADEEAIAVFAMNAQQLLLSSPLGEKRVLAIDPGFRTGCKWVCLSEHGALLDYGTIFPHEPQRQTEAALKSLEKVIKDFEIQAIAVGNGTAGRETLHLVQGLVGDRLPVFSVNESGASIYSASAIAREEFPHHDVTVRGAVSIGRRLMDPLAELVKIDPKSIGVGQYQHDVNQSLLQDRLTDVVTLSVNKVGVNLNTASKHLLSYVSGLGPSLAEKIIAYRAEINGFNSREELKNVPRLGAKAFEQCAGFLRIRGSQNPLDNTGVHPERYALVKKMAKTVGVQVVDLIGNSQHWSRIDLAQFVNDAEDIGLPTLEDIKSEMLKPGLDPRGVAENVRFDAMVQKLEDLREGMQLNGVVTNMTNFGCFVDIGVKQDGLVHISEMADRFIKHPSEVVQLGQQVYVRVVQIDLQRKRLGLSMKS